MLACRRVEPHQPAIGQGQPQQALAFGQDGAHVAAQPQAAAAPAIRQIDISPAKLCVIAVHATLGAYPDGAVRPLGKGPDHGPDQSAIGGPRDVVGMVLECAAVGHHQVGSGIEGTRPQHATVVNHQADDVGAAQARGGWRGVVPGFDMAAGRVDAADAARPGGKPDGALGVFGNGGHFGPGAAGDGLHLSAGWVYPVEPGGLGANPQAAVACHTQGQDGCCGKCGDPFDLGRIGTEAPKTALTSQPDGAVGRLSQRTHSAQRPVAGLRKMGVAALGAVQARQTDSMANPEGAVGGLQQRFDLRAG